MVCMEDVYICPESGVVLERDPAEDCQFPTHACAPSTGTPPTEHAEDCATDRGRAAQCYHTAKALGWDVDDETWPFFSEDVDNPAAKIEYPYADQLDKSLYIPGCYVYTSGSLQGKAFYGGESAHGMA